MVLINKWDRVLFTQLYHFTSITLCRLNIKVNGILGSGSV